MQKFGAAASLFIGEFKLKNLIRFPWGFEGAGGKDESWAKAMASQRQRKYVFMHERRSGS